MKRPIAPLALILAPLVLLTWRPALADEPALGANLAALLTHAQQHNPEYAAMRLDAQAAQERVEPAGALPDPRLRTTLQDITRMGTQNPTVLPARTGKTAYQWMQDLPWMGKRGLKRDIAQLDAQGALARARGSWSELSARIKATYAQIFLVHRSEQVTQENLDLMARLEQVALSRYASGLSPQQDVIRAQVEQGNLASEQVNLQMEHHHLHARMNALLARDSDLPLADPAALRSLPPATQLDWSRLREQLHLHNPQLFAQEAQVAGAEKNRELTRKNRYPDFTVGLTPTQYGSAIREWELMVEVNIPLQQGTRAAQEREAQALLDAAQARKQAAINQATTELTQALSALDSARQAQALIATRLLPQAELTFQAALAGYETGKVDFATLLDAQRQIRQARLSQLKSEVDANLQLADIERLIGEDL